MEKQESSDEVFSPQFMQLLCFCNVKRERMEYKAWIGFYSLEKDEETKEIYWKMNKS